jgi:cell division protein FtsN
MPPKKKIVQKTIPEATAAATPEANNEPTPEQRPLLLAKNIDNGEHTNGESPKIINIA